MSRTGDVLAWCAAVLVWGLVALVATAVTVGLYVLPFLPLWWLLS